MTQSDDLHDLVHALSPTETRSILRRLKQNSTTADTPNVLVLFNALRDMVVHDVDDLRQRLRDHPAIVRNLPAYKRHLKQRIFDTLRTAGQPTHDQRIAHAFADFRIASEKRLFGLARKRIQQAIDLARRAERLGIEVMLLNEYQLFLQTYDVQRGIRNLTTILERKRVIMDVMVEENEVLNDYFRTIVTYQAYGDSSVSRALFEQLRQPPDRATERTTPEARRVQAQMQSTIHQILKDGDASLVWQERTVEAFRENKLYRERKGEVYALAMLNLMNRYSTPGTENRFQALRRAVLHEIDRLRSDTLPSILLNREILHGLRTLRFDDLDNWTRQVEARRRSTAMQQITDLNNAYNLAICLLLCERWADASRFLQVIIDQRGTMRRDFYLAARLIDMVCVLEQGATDHLLYLVRSDRRSVRDLTAASARSDWLAILRSIARRPSADVAAYLRAEKERIQDVIKRLPRGLHPLMRAWVTWRLDDRKKPLVDVARAIDD